MLQARYAASSEPTAATATSLRVPLWTLIYHSRAVAPMSDAALRGLQERAQSRNRVEGVTGLVIYDAGSFYQCLEGPEDSLERIWASVSRDPRHTDIELMSHHPVDARSFEGWNLQLSTRATVASDGLGRAMTAQLELIEKLQRRPQDAELLLHRHGKWLQTLGSADFPRFDHVRVAPKRALDPRHLQQVVETLVLPRLSALIGTEAPLPITLPDLDDIDALVHLLVADDPAAAIRHMQSLDTGHLSSAARCLRLLEPAARALGDLWQHDDCTEVAMTIGLCRLQSMLHRLMAPAARATIHGLPSVLVVPQPGELHRFGAALDAEMLWQAGWQTQFEAPADDAALESLVSESWFDAVDLTLSSSFRREHWLPRMAVTIAELRRASRNPNLVVHVSGRIFHEQAGAGIVIGADVSSRSAALTGLRILEALRRKH